MKKTVRWILGTVVFIALGLVIFNGISEILRKKVGAYSDMVHSFYELEEDSLDVLCLGSSHGYSAIQPNVMWNDYGITSYVMCSPKQSLPSAYYLLKEALQYQKPQVLLLESYYFRFAREYVDEATLRQAFDGIRFGEAKKEMVEDFLGDLSFKDQLSYYLPFLKYHSRWNELVNYDFVSRSYLKGGILGFKTIENEDPGIPEEIGEVPEIVCEYLDKIIALCEENDIQIVVFAAPFGIADDYKAYAKAQRVNNALEVYLGERDIPFLYYQKTGEAGIDFMEDFRDTTHLNSYGSEKITQHLGGYLTENYGFEDHRADEKYQSWNEDYEEYQALVEKLQGSTSGDEELLGDEG